MPMYDFTCEVCGTERRAWREEGHPPRFCSVECRNKGLFSKSLKPIKWKLPREADDAIRDAYQTAVGFSRRAVVKDLAERFGVPRWKISRRASRLGLIPKTKKEPPWSEKEIAILEHFAHLSPPVIQRHLKKHGFHRSETGIVVKRKKMRFLSNLNGYTASAVARGFGIDIHSVSAWIQDGKLKAVKRGTLRHGKRHGDIYYILPESIREFVTHYVDEVDIRKVDKHWFVEILTGSGRKQVNEKSPCVSCKWKDFDKTICAPGCEKIKKYNDSQAPSYRQTRRISYFGDQEKHVVCVI